MTAKFFQGFCWTDVTNSSNVLAFGYDLFKEVLRVQYKDQVCYDYKGVEPAVVLGLYHTKNAGLSVGKFIHQHLKGKYDINRVELPHE